MRSLIVVPGTERVKQADSTGNDVAYDGNGDRDSKSEARLTIVYN